MGCKGSLVQIQSSRPANTRGYETRSRSPFFLEKREAPLGDSGHVILVSNDDGVRSEGIVALAEALKDLGTVYVVAPDRERSAASHSLSLTHPLRVEKLSPRVYSVDGTPTDCVNLGVNGILRGKKIDLLVSGHQQGREPGRRYHLLRHRLRGDGGDAARHPLHRRLAGHPYPVPVRHGRGDGAGRGAKSAEAGSAGRHPAERQRARTPRARRSRACGSRGWGSGSTAT